MILFGWLYIGRLPEGQAHQQNLRKLTRKIMATQAEIAERVRQATVRAVNLTNQITKIGTETDALKKKIDDLENALPGDVSPELETAVADLKSQFTALEEATKATDDKVPDPS